MFVAPLEAGHRDHFVNRCEAYAATSRSSFSLAGIARSELGAEAGALTDERQTILGAVDFLLTGF
jgi:hypothetical protein